MTKKIAIFGGSGLVGSRFIKLNQESFEIDSPDVSEVDILDKDKIFKFLEHSLPDVVVNFAAFTNVEEAEKQKDDKESICYKINALGAKNVARVCKELDKKLIHVSTEYVFDGTKENSPYVEEDKPNPINWYGQTKYAGEQFVLESGCGLIIARICMPFSPFYTLKKDVARFFLEELRKGNKIKAIEDQKVTPTYVNDIADALKILIESDVAGIYHISSTDSVSPLEFAKTIVRVFHLDYSLISSMSLEEYNKNKLAKLLSYSWLNPTKFEEKFGEGILHTVEEGLILFKNGIDAARANQI